MGTAALLLTLASALLHATRDFLIKRSIDKIAFSWLLRVLGIALILPLAILRFHDAIPANAWLLIVASAVIHVLYALSLAKAYEKGDLSLIYPIARSAPIFVLLWSTLIWREAMSPVGIAGILVIALGAHILQMRTFSLREFAAPIRMALRDRSLRFAWVTALLVATYSLIDDRGVALIDPVVFLLLYGALTCLLMAPILLITRKAHIVSEWRLRWPQLLAAAVASSGGYLLALFALRMEHVGYVTGVRQVSILFSVILGWRVLKEPNGWGRLLGVVIMIGGMLMIGLTT